MEKQLNERVFAGGELRIQTFRDGKLIREIGPFKNKVVASSGYGRNLIARKLVGDNTYDIAIDTASIGTGTAAPADGDTDLATVTHSDLPITNASASNNVVTVDVFVPDANLSNTTYKEYGLYISGQLFARVLISPNYTKASGEDTLFTYTLTITG